MLLLIIRTPAYLNRREVSQSNMGLVNQVKRPPNENEYQQTRENKALQPNLYELAR